MQHQQTLAPVSVFYSYAHEDEPLREQLEKHLSLLHRQGLISEWHDQEILPGTEWSREIDEHLEMASIILLLISPDFLASDYCSGIELQRSLQRHQANEARVIPILLRPVDWRGAPFEQIKVLPTNAQPITTWRNRDQAFANVAAGIRRAIEDLASLSASTPHVALPSVSSHPSQTDQLTDAPLQKSRDHRKTLDLPVQPTPFIGREQEIAEVTQLLSRDDVRLLTLTGPGGSGKTRLGLQVTIALHDSFPDGACFVDLTPITDPDLVIPTLFRKLSLQERRGQSLLEHLKQYLQQKQVLLLLDNFEQVVSAAGQVADLLAACSQLKIVVTSREVLHVRAEHEYVVPPLALPDLTQPPDLEALAYYDAVALFIQRSEVVKSSFQLTMANAPTVVEICTRLDGLPLAIELAAARMKLLSPKALLMRLSPCLPILTSETQDVPARQQTLRNTIAWSYQLLDAQEKRLLQRLCIFIGGCTLEAIETVSTSLGDGDGSVLDGVTSLIDKSLLRQTEQTEEEPRLMMLETIREYGLECLTTSGEMELTRRAHAAYYLPLAEEAEQQLFGSEQTSWFNRLEREHDNLRAALKWCIECQESKMALRLASALWQFWWLHGHLREGRTALEGTLAAAQTVPASLRAKALARLGVLVGMQGNYGRAEALCEESLGLLRELQEPQAGMVIPLWMQGLVAFMQSNFAVASTLAEQALVLSRQVDNTWGIASSLRLLGYIASDQGKYVIARARIEEYLELSRKMGNTQAIADGIWLLGLVVFEEGDLPRAHTLFTESLALSREVGDKRTITYSLALLGEVTSLQGEYVKAHALLEESLEYARNLEDQQALIWGIYGQAWLAFWQGDYMGACKLFKQCLMLLSQLDYHSPISVAICLEGLAAVIYMQGEPARAVRLGGQR